MFYLINEIIFVLGLLFVREISEGICLGVWKCDESITNLPVPENDPSYVIKKSEIAKKQYICSRLLINSMMAKGNVVEVGKEKSGNPILLGHNQKLSISHSGEYIAVLISEDKNIGVDIEIIADKILRINEKFMTKKELALLIDSDLHDAKKYSHVLWGAKEALFKLYSKGGVSFKENLLVDLVSNYEKGTVSACVNVNEQKTRCDLEYFTFDNYMIVCAMQCDN